MSYRTILWLRLLDSSRTSATAVVVLVEAWLVPAMPGATPTSGSKSKPIHPKSSISGSNSVGESPLPIVSLEVGSISSNTMGSVSGLLFSNWSSYFHILELLFFRSWNCYFWHAGLYFVGGM
jgi:hypothetical protein